jgi:hypothetical protein
MTADYAQAVRDQQAWAAIENGGIETQVVVEEALVHFLNFCENSTISTEIAALQSQASLMSALGNELATTTNSVLASMTSAMSITPAPTTASQTGTAVSSCATDGSASAACKPSGSASQSAKSTGTGIASAESTPATSSSPPLNSTWIAGPVLGSVLGLSAVFFVIYFTNRKWKQSRKPFLLPPPKEFHDDASNHSHSSQSHSPDPPMELQTIEPIHELPAAEPVGSELSTPMEARMRDDAWPVSPLPLSPLPLLFAMSELRDERVGNVSPKHDTYYNP